MYTFDQLIEANVVTINENGGIDIVDGYMVRYNTSNAIIDTFYDYGHGYVMTVTPESLDAYSTTIPLFDLYKVEPVQLPFHN